MAWLTPSSLSVVALVPLKLNSSRLVLVSDGERASADLGVRRHAQVGADHAVKIDDGAGASLGVDVVDASHRDFDGDLAVDVGQRHVERVIRIRHVGVAPGMSVPKLLMRKLPLRPSKVVEYTAALAPALRVPSATATSRADFFMS
jgi:hypothetical protein